VPGTTRPLLDARAPVLFASDDEEQHPVRFNEKPYRGRLEVFANTRGTLTVVNVVPLEDYVRGVVPNELSPGGWPELEALKAQAVAARTYAVSNLGRFGSQGFDLTPDTRSQVYGGRSTEHPLTDRAEVLHLRQLRLRDLDPVPLLDARQDLDRAQRVRAVLLHEVGRVRDLIGFELQHLRDDLA